MKAATPPGGKVSSSDGQDSSSVGSSRAQTPDNASIAESTDGSTTDGDRSQYLSASTAGSTADGEGSTLLPSNASVRSAQSGKSDQSDSSKGKAKGKSAPSSIADKNGKDESKESHSSTDNLVGKLNNLVTTDLNNIVEGRDFMLICKRSILLSPYIRHAKLMVLSGIYSPLMIAFGIWFLYSILGWRFVCYFLESRALSYRTPVLWLGWL